METDGSSVKVDGVSIQAKYFDLLKSLSPNVEIYGDREKLWLYFKNDECRGLIMGYGNH